MTYQSSYELDIPIISIRKLIDKYPSLQANSIKKPIRSNNQITRQRLQLDFEYEYDFSTTKNQIDITEIIIQDHFNISNYKLRRDKLCPRINNRMEYLLILESCLIEPCCIDKAVQDANYVIDIGTGSSLVYPIIGTKISQFKNKYIATEINETSVNHIGKILNENIQLQNNVQLVKGNNQQLIPEISQDKKVKYLVCNPPFYTNIEELNEKEGLKKTIKPNELTIDDSELIYDQGGELAFIRKLIDESTVLINSPNTFPTFENCWFTSQVGIHSHLEELNEYIELRGIPFKFNESIKFNTTRWIIGWRFGGHQSVMIQKYVSPLNWPSRNVLQNIFSKLHQHLEETKGRFNDFQFKLITVKHNRNVFYVRTNEYIWLRKIRRLLSNSTMSRSSDLSFDKDILIRIFVDKGKDNFDLNILTNEVDHNIHYNSLKSMINQLLVPSS
ncbi:hypothetical protein DFJ63DRAFT_320872 [Scheffersomyces coipomensis]|uniref:uncharacterized protein n=1 Tax=Scheffersomyces coipomensis TaxID=1788519 RepID=UPI00315D0D19